MSKKPVNIRKISNQDFANACAAAEVVVKGGEIERAAFSRDPFQALAFLESIRDGTWPKPDQYHPAIIPDARFGAKDSTKVQHARNANIILDHLAGKSVDPAYRIYIESHDRGRYFGVYWAERFAGEGGSGEPDLFGRIAIIGKFHKDIHAIHFMRGALSMARELGVGITDRRGERSAYEDYRLRGTDPFLKRGGDTLAPDRDAILMHFEDPTASATLIHALSNLGFHVITTGYLGGDVTANHPALADRLAAQAVRDEMATRPTGRRKAIVIGFSDKPDGHVYTVRQDAIIDRIDRSDCLFSELLDLKSDPFVDADHNLARKKLDRRLRKRLRVGDVAAFFGRTDQITADAADIVASLGVRTRVYTEIITQGTLLRLADSRSPLHAVCGTDPYYHGRYAVRAASYRDRKGTEHRSIDPILITKRAALEGSIFSSDRIPAIFDGRDVQLNGGDYAWPASMKRRCLLNYGPMVYQAAVDAEARRRP